MPELFSGFGRKDYKVPVRYPVACHPQAWAAASIPFLLQNILGIVPDGFKHTLHIVRPMLPEFVDRLSLRNLRIADGTVDLSFERQSEMHASVKVTRADKGIEVKVV